MRQILNAAIATLFLTVLGNCAWAQDFDAGVDAAKSKDYATALENFLPLAMQGKPSSQFNMGVMYYNGYGVPKDYAVAVKWFRKAGENGSKDAQRTLGMIYEQGLHVAKDSTEAKKWYDMADGRTESGSDGECPMTDEMSDKLASLGYSKDYLEMVYGKEALCNLLKNPDDSDDLFSGIVIPDSKEPTPVGVFDPKEVDHYDGMDGVADKKFKIAMKAYLGDGEEKDYSKAFSNFSAAASLGHPEATYWEGRLYYKGWGVEQNYEHAFRDYSVAASSGVPKAVNGMGVLYYFGRGVDKEKIIAYAWFSMAAELGNEDAKNNLSIVKKELSEDEILIGDGYARLCTSKHYHKCS